MHSRVPTPAAIAQAALDIAKHTIPYNQVRPVNFIHLMEHNHGTAREVDAHGLSRKNPLIVACGDSVTAGWFEGNTLFPEALHQAFFKDTPAVEHVTDIGNVYHELFKLMLSERYERTSVSVINSGISGDNVVGILTRLARDVLRYDPDLVLLNACLNGPEDLVQYESSLRDIAQRLQRGTHADIVFITPNMVREQTKGTLDERVGILLSVADEFGFCVADTYATWHTIAAGGIDISSLLANELNHPTVTGHQLYAMEIMKLLS